MTAEYERAERLLRLALGSMFIAHAALKYFVFTLPGTAAFFGSLCVNFVNSASAPARSPESARSTPGSSPPPVSTAS